MLCTQCWLNLKAYVLWTPICTTYIGYNNISSMAGDCFSMNHFMCNWIYTYEISLKSVFYIQTRCYVHKTYIRDNYNVKFMAKIFYSVFRIITFILSFAKFAHKIIKSVNKMHSFNMKSKHIPLLLVFVLLLSLFMGHILSCFFY